MPLSEKDIEDILEQKIASEEALSLAVCEARRAVGLRLVIEHFGHLDIDRQAFLMRADDLVSDLSLFLGYPESVLALSDLAPRALATFEKMSDLLRTFGEDFAPEERHRQDETADMIERQCVELRELFHKGGTITVQSKLFDAYMQSAIVHFRVVAGADPTAAFGRSLVGACDTLTRLATAFAHAQRDAEKKDMPES